MKQSLQLKLGQHLTMTPQLQQAIRLLQLSAMELSVEIQEALESNMMLEVADGADDYEDLSFSAADTAASSGNDSASHCVRSGQNCCSEYSPHLQSSARRSSSTPIHGRRSSSNSMRS